MNAARTLRCFHMLWRRQGRKSSTLAEIAIDLMSAFPGLLVTYASASLNLGREFVVKESAALRAAWGAMNDQARTAGLLLEAVDGAKAKPFKADDEDLFSELFEAQKLEFRLWHDRTRHSRTVIIAPNPATARGWSGTVILDEFGFIRDFAALWEAVEPIISSNPEFRFIGGTTPPEDDNHYSYALTAPPVGTEFAVNPKGNWYRSEIGELIHRVDIYDAHAAGLKIYDRKSGREMTPEQHRASYHNRDAWSRNYGIVHVIGGSAACGLIELNTAQTRGIGRCALFEIHDDAGFRAALAAADKLLPEGGQVGVGFDVATTEKKTSNPSAMSVVRPDGAGYAVPVVMVWKSKDPAVVKERIASVLNLAAGGGRTLRRMAVDATSEKLFAAEVARDFRHICPVELVVASETTMVPGREESVNYKTLLGDLLVAALADNRLTLPPEQYLRTDWRLVMKSGGAYLAEPDGQGRHADTFDSSKLALWALTRPGNSVTATLI